MESRKSHEICSFWEVVLGNTNVASNCNICTQENNVISTANGSRQFSETIHRHEENYGSCHITDVLKQYYEGTPLFYAPEQRKAKVFKPTLIYHAYNTKPHRDNSVHDVNKPNGCSLTTRDTQDRNSKAALSDKINQDCTETLKFQDDEETQQDTTVQRTDDSRRLPHSNLFHNTQNQTDSVTCEVQSEETTNKSGLLEKSVFPENRTLRLGCFRSAFSKPYRFREVDFNYSNTADTYIENAANLEYTAHNPARNTCDLTYPPLCYSVYVDSDYYNNVRQHSLTLTRSPSVSSSRYSGQCMCTHCVCDISAYSPNAELATRQLPILSHVHGNANPPLFYFDSSSLYRPCVDDLLLTSGTLIPNDKKVPDDYHHHRTWESSSTTADISKTFSKVRPVDKPYTCECGRAFARSEELTRHKRIHSGYRPFRCSVCDKTFGRKDHMNKHRITHLHTSEKKVHTCNVKDCQQRYTRSDALARHQWAIHGIKARVQKLPRQEQVSV